MSMMYLFLTFGAFCLYKVFATPDHYAKFVNTILSGKTSNSDLPISKSINIYSKNHSRPKQFARFDIIKQLLDLISSLFFMSL